MKDNPDQIADWLVEEHGPEGAKQMALNGVFQALDVGDNYRLSVWPEVRHVLAQRFGDTS